MKKKFFVFVFVFFCAVNSFAQLFELAKHEIRVYSSDGMPLGNVLTLIDRLSFENDYTRAAGTAGMDYTYNILDRFAIGGGFNFAKNTKKDIKGLINGGASLYNWSFYFAMKAWYFKTDLLKFYGFFSVGVGINFIDGEGFNTLYPAVQISPFGIRVGTDIIAAFLEFGYGTTGIMSAGLLVNIY